jgi:DGQHR domain-containing protein
MRIVNARRIVQWGYGQGADKIDLYVLTIPAAMLAQKAEIFRRTPDRREGYQRELQPARLSRGKFGVAGYLLDQMGIFPTSVLVNVRREQAQVDFQKKGGENWDEVGDLTIPDNATWFVVDGQHRLEGLKIAMREEEELANYPVIVTMTNQEIFDEMLLFYLVNSRAKSVSTGLAYRILQRMLYDKVAPKWIEGTMMVGADRRKAIAATIVDYLNMDLDGPFKGKIQEIGEPEAPEHLTTDETLARYVTMILKESIFSEMYDKDVAQLLAEYWAAVAEVYPRCFRKPEDYMLLGTIGLSSFSRLFPTIYGYCARDSDISEKNMARYLHYLTEATPDHRDVDFRRAIDEKWWHRVDGPGIVHGTGEGHYTEVASKLADKISIAIAKRRK